MSYRIDGVCYHTWAEYRRAVRRRELRAAREETVRLLAEATRLRGRIDQGRDALERPGEGVEQHMGAMVGVERDVRELRRLQDRIVGARERAEVRIEETLRAAMPAAGPGDGVETMEGESGNLLEEARSLDAAREELRRTVAGAEENERRIQERMQELSGQLDRRLEESRVARVAARQGELDQASEQLALVEEMLAEVPAPDLETLALAEDVAGIREQLAAARRVHAGGSGGGALATASTAFAAARTLLHKARRRRAELAEMQRRVRGEVAHLRGLLEDPGLKRYFEVEVGLAGRLLARIEARAKDGYRTYRTLEIEAGKDLEVISRLRGEVARMGGAVEVVRDLARERKARAKELLASLSRQYGPMRDIQQRFATEGDRKSSLVMECDFGGARVEVFLGLDGEYSIDGFGHDSNATCSRRAEGVAEDLARGHAIGGSRVDPQNRSAAEPREGGGAAGWRGISDALRRLDEDGGR